MGFERLKLRTGDAAGYYVPRGFYIRLNRDAFDSSLHLRKSAAPLFFHEYIHLLQDRTTLHGAIDFLQFINGIQSTFKHASFFDSVVPVPLRSALQGGKHSQDGNECWLAITERIRQIVSGQDPWPTACNLTLIDKKIQNETIYSSEFQLATPQVVLTFADQLGTQYEHNLTSWEICEGYAMAIESLLGGIPPSELWAYEYHAIQTIFAAYYSNLNPWQIAAVCQWSLQSPAPATTFFALLDALKSAYQNTLPSFEQVFDFCRDHLFMSGFSDNVQGAAAELTSTIASQRVGGKDNGLSSLYNWYTATTIANLNSTANSNSDRFPLGVLNKAINDIIQGEDSSTALVPLFSKIPVPMIDQDDRPYFTIGSPKIEVDSVMLLRCVTTIVNQIWAGTNQTIECPLYGKCLLPCRNGLCISTPWTNVVPGTDPCSFGYAGAAFNLTHKSFAPIP